MPAFFGLTAEYKPMMHSEIFNLLYYGKGGFDWESVYLMPIFLRRFYIKKINEAVQQENKMYEEARKKSSKSLDKPGVTPRRK